MEMAFYILAASWVILLVVCIVLIVRFKNLHDTYDVSLDTVIGLQKTLNDTLDENQSLLNRLDAAEQNIDFLENKCEKLEKHKATKEDKVMVIEASYNIDHVREYISIPKKIADRIETMDDKDLHNLELSMERYIKEAVVSSLLYYCNYAVSYEVFNDSYTFLIDIPVARKNDSRSVYMEASSVYPMVDIFKKLAKEE